jgi:hypothetical protein
VPSGVVFMALGHLIAGLVLQSGAFSQRDSYWVWATLAGSSVGLLASSQGRLLASTYLRARRHAPAARVRDRARRVHAGARLHRGAVRPALFGSRRALGHRGPHRERRHRGWIEFLLLRRTLAQADRRVRSVGRAAARLWARRSARRLSRGVATVLLAPHMARGLARMGGGAVARLFTVIYGVATLALGIGTARSLQQRLTNRAAR